MTWNINWGGPRPDLVPQTILDEDPDIVCLQETTAAWERFLRPRLRGRYPHIEFRHAGGAGGQAFLSKYAFRERSYDPSPRGWFPAWTVVAEAPVGPVQVQNLHLHPAVNEQGSFTPAAYLSSAPRARLEEVEVFSRTIDPGKAALIAGDLNEESGYAVGHIHKQGFTDALPEFDSSTKTWEWYTSLGIKVSGRLDHILYNEYLYCTRARVLKAGGSDHYPVVAVFERSREE
jgi:endonuclease/exonuclease/phosphatase family metal-dependent hydrolase